MFTIEAVSHEHDDDILHRINQKTKPLGALGQLETLAAQIARVQIPQKETQILKPAMLVFAGDHGIAQYGVSIAPSEVTGQMVNNFVHGGAAINVFCRQLGWSLDVVDCGILVPIDHKAIHCARLGAGTAAFHVQPAMTVKQVRQGFLQANEIVEQHFSAGCNIIALGEMGIGNTSSATAIMAAILGLNVADCVGRGTGVDDKTLQLKTQLINQALTLHQQSLTSEEQILACLGGFEIVHIIGAILAAAQRRMLLVIDGFIVTAAALVAVKMYPNVRDYLIFAHQSDEQGHKLMLAQLHATPLLTLGLRLGEGTGAALALPLIQAASNFYNQMASFDDAGVNNVV